jgi:hypothetical protein
MTTKLIEHGRFHKECVDGTKTTRVYTYRVGEVLLWNSSPDPERPSWQVNCGKGWEGDFATEQDALHHVELEQ